MFGGDDLHRLPAVSSFHALAIECIVFPRWRGIGLANFYTILETHPDEGR